MTVRLVDRVLFRDQLVIVLNKPAGLPVHGGPGGKASVADQLADLTFGYKETPELAHRLDADTSGCLVLGRNHRALRKLGKAFSQHQVTKTYWAIVAGRPAKPAGTISAPLLKVSDRSGWKMIVDEAGKAAVSDYHVLGEQDGSTWIEVKPRTGRTHQVRVHLAALGCPILGDPNYGGTSGQGPLQLHARQIVLPLFEDRDPLDVTAPPPAHMAPYVTT